MEIRIYDSFYCYVFGDEQSLLLLEATESKLIGAMSQNTLIFALLDAKDLVAEDGPARVKFHSLPSEQSCHFLPDNK